MEYEVLNLEPNWDLKIDIPELSPLDYTKAIETFIEKISKIEGVIGGFQFGSVKHPGISDLDLGIVVRDDCSDETILKLIEYKDLGDRAMELILHSPLIIPESLIENIFYTRTISNIEKLWGSTDLRNNLSEDEKKYSDIANYIDWTYRAYEQSILLLKSRKPSLRALFVALGKCEKSLKSAFWINNKVLPKELLGIRKTFLHSREYRNLNRLIFETLKASISLLNRYDLELTDYMLSQGHIKPVNNYYAIKYFGNFYINFYETSLKPSADNIVYKIKFKNFLESEFETSILLNLPILYPVQFSAYSLYLNDIELRKMHGFLYPKYLSNSITGQEYISFLMKRAHYSSQLKSFFNDRTKRAWSLGLGTGFRWPETNNLTLFRKLIARLKNREIRKIALNLIQD